MFTERYVSGWRAGINSNIIVDCLTWINISDGVSTSHVHLSVIIPAKQYI